MNALTYGLILEADTKAIFDKYYKDQLSVLAKRLSSKSLTHAAFLAVIKADPTSKVEANGNVPKLGDYTKWIMKQLLGQQSKEAVRRFLKEDLFKYTVALKEFHDLKVHGKLPAERRDINTFRDLADLTTYLRAFQQEAQQSLSDSIKQATKFVYEDENCFIVIPETFEASVYWGQGTTWCTAIAGYPNQYKSYSSRGPLYIIISKKNPNEKFQLHFPDSQFMDKDDRPVSFRTLVERCGSGFLNLFIRDKKMKSSAVKSVALSDISFDYAKLEKGYNILNGHVFNVFKPATAFMSNGQIFGMVLNKKAYFSPDLLNAHSDFKNWLISHKIAV